MLMCNIGLRPEQYFHEPATYLLEVVFIKKSDAFHRKQNSHIVAITKLTFFFQSTKFFEKKVYKYG